MNAKDFITHYAKKIIHEETRAPRRDIISTTRLKLSRMTIHSKAALALAASNPTQLAKNLKVNNYTDNYSNNPAQSIYHFLTEVVKEDSMNEAYGVPHAESRKVILPVEMISSKDAAISPHQAPRYIKAALTAGALLGLVVFDIEDDKVDMFISRTSSDDDEKIFEVHITIK